MVIRSLLFCASVFVALYIDTLSCDASGIILHRLLLLAWSSSFPFCFVGFEAN